MAEGFHNRMVHLLSLTLERINVKSEFEVVMIGSGVKSKTTAQRETWTNLL